MKNLKYIIKLLIGVGALTWLIRSGKINFTVLTILLDHPVIVLVSFSLLVCQIAISSWRWGHIVQGNSSHGIPFKKLVSLSWIGVFFSTVLPGAVTGDLIKINYAKKEVQKSVRFLFFSVLLDRIIGLSALITLSFFSSVYNRFLHIGSNAIYVNEIFFMNVSLMAGVLVFYSFIYWGKGRVKGASKLSIRVSNFMDSFLGLKDKLNLKVLFLVSLVAQFFNVLSFLLLLSLALKEIAWFKMGSVIPIGLMTLALPISPAGVGVGHVAFENLFNLIEVQNGASLFNIFWVVSTFVNLLGLIPFLFRKER